MCLGEARGDRWWWSGRNAGVDELGVTLVESVGEVRLWLVGGHADPYGMTNKKSKSKSKSKSNGKGKSKGKGKGKGKSNGKGEYRGLSAASR